MVQSEILNRVFRLVYGDPDKKKFSSGTAFTMEYNHSQFLVTAKHIFKTGQWALPEDGAIWLLTEGGKYTPYEVDIRYPADSEVDIAVMKPKNHHHISEEYPNRNTSEGMIFGQDVFFLGFPYEYDELLLSFPDSKRPVPFIKKACFSGGFSDGHACMIFDGHNNPGFSGRPVCYKSMDAPDGIMSIAAVISGYRYEKQFVFNENGQRTGSYVESNTGIIFAYDIREAVNVAEHWADEIAR